MTLTRFPETILREWIVVLVVVSSSLRQMIAAEDAKQEWKAPANHSIISNTINGWYFVPKELKKEYDSALGRLEMMESEIDSGQIGSNDALKEFTELKSRLQLLRAKIEDTRIHVAGAAINEQTETMEFDLGPEKRLAITANQVRVVGWDGPNVKVELKKMVLSKRDELVDEQLKAIAIVHKFGHVQFAGQTDAEWAAREAEFLAKEGAKLTQKQLADRAAFIKQIRDSYAIHRELLSKDVDQITVDGLDYRSNRVIEKAVKSEGGDGQMGSVRQRYAELTVHVPRCTSVTIRGARRGMVVEGLSADLIIVDQDSTDSDDRGDFHVHGLNGKLICRNFPLREVMNVQGHVDIESTTEYAVDGAGTSYRDDLRELTPGRPFGVRIHDVTDGVDLRYGRVKLVLRNIGGIINVVNEFGDTHFSAVEPLAVAPHRIVSQSGRIDADLIAEAWLPLSIVAVTNHGGVRTNVPREQFDDFHLTGDDKFDHVRRNWSGFRTVVEGEDRMAVFRLIDRFAAILSGNERSNGLDLITRSGRIVILRK